MVLYGIRFRKMLLVGNFERYKVVKEASVVEDLFSEAYVKILHPLDFHTIVFS